MAFAMPPPSLPAFSLRVQLFAPTAYGSEDKPIRNFRVVIDPEATIQEFCQEASRIHQVNYGQPIAIKRCQDDQGFDITQTELVGSIFASANTIRVIQASSFPNVRDSVPPTSALRFDPTSLLGKRNRAEASPKSNGTILPPNSYKPNKRQRVVDLDPDQPLASLEEEAEISRGHIIPNSQEGVVLGNRNVGSSSRQVRPDFLRVQIFGTPSPPPSSVKSEDSADTFSFKFTEKRSNLPNEIRESSPVGEGRERSRSKSLGINGSKERAISVPRKPESPANGEDLSLTNGFESSGLGLNGGVSRPRRINGHIAPRAQESIYDQIVSGDEGAALLKIKQAALRRGKNSPANGNVMTPPAGQRRSRENSTPNELALTPQSAKQQQRQKEEANKARKARLAAAEAAEQRKRDAAEEIRLAERREQEAEEAQRAEQARVEREELGRIVAGNLKRDEAEQLAREEREREAEKQRIVEDKKKLEGSAARKAQEEEDSIRMASSPPEDSRRTHTKSPVLPRAGSVRAQSSTPFIPIGRKSSLKMSSVNGSSPAPRKGSSTGVGIDDNMPMPISKSPRRVSFIEGDKETPDRPAKSTFTRMPSTPHPAAGKNKSKSASTTPETATPKTIVPGPENNRRSKSITPSISASKVNVLASVASKSTSPDMAPPKTKTTPQSAIPKSQTILPTSVTAKPKAILPPGAILRAASGVILPPPRAYRTSGSDRSFSPQVPLNASREATPLKSATAKKPVAPPAQRGTSVLPPSSTIPLPSPRAPSQPIAAKPQMKKEEPESESSSSEEESEDSESNSDGDDEKFEKKVNAPTLKSPALLAQDSPVKTTEVVEPDVSESSEDSDEDNENEIPPRTQRVMISPSPSTFKTNKEVEEQAILETPSHNSSVRDSRSPVRFNENTQPRQNNRLSSPESKKISRKDDENDDSSSDSGDVEMPDVAVHTTADETSESEVEDEDITIQVPKSSAPIMPTKKISPVTSQEKITSSKPSTSKDPTSLFGSSSQDTQDEVDDQLISSMIEARPKSSSPASVAEPKSKLNGHGNVSSPLRPSIGFGASLKGMNEKKKAFSSSAPAFGLKGTSLKTSLMSRLEGAVDESEDEDSDDDDDSAESDTAPAAKPFPSLLKASQQSLPRKILDDEDDDSDSNSSRDSSSESESEDEMTHEQKKLLAQMTALQSRSQTQSSPSLARGTLAKRKIG